MQIHITCRQTRLTRALRAHVEEKLAKLARFVGDDGDVHVVLSVQKHAQEAEVTAAADGRPFTGTAITQDLYGAIGLVAERLEKQLRRHRRRLQDRRRRGSRLTRSRVLARTGSNGQKQIRPAPLLLFSPQAAQPMTLEEAARDLELEDKQFIVFHNSESRRMSVIYRLPTGEIGLIESD